LRNLLFPLGALQLDWLYVMENTDKLGVFMQYLLRCSRKK
jgi:hypothetical protein